MQGNLKPEDLKCLAPNRPWVLGVQNQVCSSCGIGLCDSVLCNFVRGAEAWFYDKVLVNWGIEADGAPLTIEANTEYDLMSQNGGGVGEGPILGGWYNKGLNDTDGLDGGTPVDRGFMMVTCGAAVRVGLPFQRGALQNKKTDPQLYADFLAPQEDGPVYSQRLQAITLELTSLQLKLGDTGCRYYLGTSFLFPSAQGAFGSCMVTNGIPQIPGSYMPFMVCICIGSQFDLRRATLVMTVDQNATIDSNGTVPTTVPADDLDGTVYVPYQLFLFGYCICFDTASYCGGLSLDEQAAVRRFMQSQGVLPAATG